MAGITFREQQLLKLFRSCDERGQHVIEMLARNQAAFAGQPASVPHQRSSTVTPMRR